MLATLLVTFREGLEALLICAVTLSYLRKTGRPHLQTGVYAGLFVAVILSIIFALFIEEWYSYNQELAEGIFSIVAGVLVFSLTIHMMFVGRNMKSIIEKKLELNAQKQGRWAMLGVFSFITILVLREGVEIVIILLSLIRQIGLSNVTLGGVAGLIIAAAVGFAWNRYSRSINLGIFLQVTAIFLALFSVHLVFYGLHELVNYGSISLGAKLDSFFQSYSSRNLYVQIFTSLIVIIPLFWMVISLWRSSRLTYSKS